MELIAEEDVTEFGPIVGQHGPVFRPGGRKHGQVHLAAGVQQVCESEQEWTIRSSQTDSLTVNISVHLCLVADVECE